MAAARPCAADAIPRLGVSLAGIERFAAELAAATRGAPGGYVPGSGERHRARHAHALAEELHGGYNC